MANRREELLDAAISVLGERGIHGLSHRAVDAVARLPTGSTSNYFRTRDARHAILVEAGIHPTLRAQLTVTGARVNA